MFSGKKWRFAVENIRKQIHRQKSILEPISFLFPRFGNKISGEATTLFDFIYTRTRTHTHQSQNYYIKTHLSGFLSTAKKHHHQRSAHKTGYETAKSVRILKP